MSTGSAPGETTFAGSSGVEFISFELQALQSVASAVADVSGYLLTGHFIVFESTGSKLLLVQAEPVLAELTSFRLELLGYAIESVQSGGEAMSLLQNGLPNLVVVDTKLPDGDGIEWISRAREEYSAEQLPIIVFSLDPSLETVERAFHAGAQDYLITPFDPTVMEKKVEILLASRLSDARR